MKSAAEARAPNACTRMRMCTHACTQVQAVPRGAPDMATRTRRGAPDSMDEMQPRTAGVSQTKVAQALAAATEFLKRSPDLALAPTTYQAAERRQSRSPTPGARHGSSRISTMPIDGFAYSVSTPSADAARSSAGSSFQHSWPQVCMHTWLCIWLCGTRVCSQRRLCALCGMSHVPKRAHLACLHSLVFCRPIQD